MPLKDDPDLLLCCMCERSLLRMLLLVCILGVDFRMLVLPALIEPELLLTDTFRWSAMNE